MPKMKSKGAVKRRFRVTKNGKVMSNRPGRGHMHASKNASQRRRKNTALILDSTWGGLIKKMLGGA